MRKGSARDCGAMDDSVSNQEMLRQLDRGPLLRTIWKRVLDATERAGPRIVERPLSPEMRALGILRPADPNLVLQTRL